MFSYYNDTNRKQDEWVMYGIKSDANGVIIALPAEKSAKLIAGGYAGKTVVFGIRPENISDLPEDVENKIVETTLQIDGVIDIHELKTRRNGISYIIDAHITVASTLSIVHAHDIANNVEDALRTKFGSETQINIHMEPETVGHKLP